MKIRVIAHVHSDWSHDGRWPLSKIASFFKKRGFHCVLTSEHDESFNNDQWLSYRKACMSYSNDDFLIIPGIEYSDSRNIVHVLVWGKIPFLGAGRETEELLCDVSNFQGLSVLAHPSRREAWHKYKSRWTQLLTGVEQWNRKSDGVAPSREAISLIEQNPGLIPFVGLDFHSLNQFFPLYMNLQLRARLNEDVVLAELRNKNCHARVSGISIDHLSKGPSYKVVKGIEHFRQCLRRTVKRKFIF